MHDVNPISHQFHLKEIDRQAARQHSGPVRKQSKRQIRSALASIGLSLVAVTVLIDHFAI